METPVQINKIGTLTGVKAAAVANGLRVKLKVQRMSGFTQAGDDNNNRGEARDMCFVMGTTQLIKGFEEALSQMSAGDVAEVGIKASHAYGKVGQPPEIDADQDLYFRLELHEVSEPTKTELFESSNDEQKLAYTIEMKDAANNAFKGGNMQQAIQLYRDTVDHVLKMERHNTEARALLKVVYTNMSVAQNKERMYDDTVISAGRALDVDNKATKPLFLRATAYMKLGKFDEAIMDCKRSVQIEPNDHTIRKLYDEIKKERLMQEKLGMKGLSQAFGGSSLYAEKQAKAKFVMPAFDPKNHPQTFMDIKIGDKLLGRVVFELFNKTVPQTAENFRALCTGEMQRNLHYTERLFHRIIKGFMMQGGRIVDGNGLGMKSIYGDYFPDEQVWIPHTHKGILSMANRGPNTNGSSFFVCFGPAEHLDNKHTVFGRVISGYDAVIDQVERMQTRKDDSPVHEVKIVKAGELIGDQKLQATEADFLSHYST